MSLVRKGQGCREFCVSFILEIHYILNMPYQYFECIENLNMLEFDRVY